MALTEIETKLISIVYIVAIMRLGETYFLKWENETSRTLEKYTENDIKREFNAMAEHLHFLDFLLAAAKEKNGKEFS